MNTGIANETQLEQTDGASAQVFSARERSIVPPWPSLADLIGGPFLRGDVWYIVGYSGDGKTTLALNLTREWLGRDKAVWYLGLESRPEELRVKFAAMAIGLHPGRANTGQLTREEMVALQAELSAQSVAHQDGEGPLSGLYFSPVRFVDADSLIEDAQIAREEHGCDVFVIDHIDHVSTDGGDGMRGQYRIRDALKRMAERWPMLYLCMSQTNMKALAGSPIDRYAPVRDDHVWFPAVKRQIANGMMGVYRPLRTCPTDPVQREQWLKHVKAARSGQLEPRHVTSRNTMAINLMKSRDFGEHLTKPPVRLYVHNGHVRERYSSDDVQETIAMADHDTHD